MYNNCPHILHTNLNRSIISERNTDSFVDDTAAGFTKNAISLDTNVATEIQKLAQKYERYLFLSGGNKPFKDVHFIF